MLIINPKDSQYWNEKVGLVTDIKKLIVLFLNQKTFQKSDYSMDFDIIDRLKQFDVTAYENAISSAVNKAQIINPDDISVVQGTGDNDFLMSSYQHTNSDFLFKAIKHYHDKSVSYTHLTLPTTPYV